MANKSLRDYWLAVFFLALSITFFFVARNDSSWGAIAYMVLSIIFFGAAFLSVLFRLLINKFKLKIAWYWYILIIPAIFGIAYGLLFVGLLI